MFLVSLCGVWDWCETGFLVILGSWRKLSWLGCSFLEFVVLWVFLVSVCSGFVFGSFGYFGFGGLSCLNALGNSVVFGFDIARILVDFGFWGKLLWVSCNFWNCVVSDLILFSGCSCLELPL